MILTERKMREFFPDDNRFLHFVARKNGLFFFSDEDVETARYYAIMGVNRLLQNKFEFEDEIHMLGVIELNFKRGIFAMIQRKKALKRSLDIRVESEFIMDGKEDLRGYIENAQDNLDADVKEEMKHILEISRDALTESEREILVLRLEGRPYREISETLGVSPEVCRNKYFRLVKKLKKAYEREKDGSSRRVDAPVSEINVGEVQEGVRDRPIASHKADARDYIEVLSYLDFVQEV